MAEPFVDILKFLAYRPTRACTGILDASVLAGLNMVPKGPPDAPYFENCKSKRDTGYTAASTILSGTATVSGNIFTGSGSAYLTELQAGDFIIYASQVALVRRVISDTSFEASVDYGASPFPATIAKPRILQGLNGRHMTFTRGNLVQLARGHIVGVGAGAVQRDGAALPGGGFTLDRNLRVALYESATGNYTQIAAGLTVPAASSFAVAAIAGGTKQMPVGNYSLRLVPARTYPTSWANPTEAIPFAIAATTERVRITFNVAMETAKGQDAWRVYVSLPNEAGGPWFFYKEITSADLGGTGAGTTYTLEWRVGEVEFNETVSFRNFAPPDASFVSVQSGVIILYGTDGPGATTPGPGIRAANGDNIEAFDPEARVTLPENVIGVTQGVGRDYVACAERVYIVTLSGADGKLVTWRPFWGTGVFHPRQLVFVADKLYGCTRSGPRRSFDDGEEGSERFDFAEEVASEFRRWNLEHVIVAHDPLNEAVCYIHASPTADGAGRRFTEMLQFFLRTERWSTIIKLDDELVENLVSSAVDVGRGLSFIAGGKIYEHDKGTGAVEWYLASPFIKRDTAQQNIFGLKPVGLVTSGSLGVFGILPAGEAPDLSQNNSASLTGAITLEDAAACREYLERRVMVNELEAYAVKVQGTYAGGSAPLNRVEAIAVRGNAAIKPF